MHIVQCRRCLLGCLCALHLTPEQQHMFPEIAFNELTIHLSSRTYWHSVGQIAKLEPVKRFSNVMRAIRYCPPPSAGSTCTHQTSQSLN